MAKKPVQLDPATMADLSGLFHELAHDPETRKDIAKLVKKKYPERAAAFSDVDMQDQIEAIRAEAEQREQMTAARAYQSQLDAQRQELITTGKYNAEQADQIKTIIDRHGGTIDYNTAAILYAHENPPANPQDGPPDDQRPGATWEMPTVPGRDGKMLGFEEFAKNPNAAAQNAAYSVITEFKKRSGLTRAGAR